MRALIHVLLLALADYRHERLLSFCAIFGLAAVLAPLLILYGVKFGVLNTLTERMLSDPNTLEITPVVSGRYTKDDVRALSELPGVAFVLPRTRSIAATMNLSLQGKSPLVVSLEPTQAGDPLLERYGLPSVTMVAQKEAPQGSAKARPANPLLIKRPTADDPTLREAGAILSDMAARKLNVKKGDIVLGIVERAYGGVVSSAYVRLRVHGVLPLAAQQKETAYVPLELVEACEDFRDGRACPELGLSHGWSGEPRPDVPREYASFRMYARDLDSVARMHDILAKKGCDTYTHAEEIEQITTLERGLTLIFSLICLAAMAGFFFSTTSSVLAGIRRKQRTLGLLQLMGFSKETLVAFPLAQVVLTALLVTSVAAGAYALAAHFLNQAFAGSLQGLEQICRLLPRHFALAYAISVGISLLAALAPAWQSSKIEPSEVIRDV